MRRSTNGSTSTRTLKGLLAAGALGLASLAPVLPVASTYAAVPSCTAPAGSGLQVNEWIGTQAAGTTGQWDVPASWSLGTVPDLFSADELVCIRGAATVQMAPLAGIQVNAGALDLGGTATVAVDEGNKLFLDGDPAVVSSLVRLGTTVRVSGATLGGTGRIYVYGHVTWGSLGRTAGATIASRSCSLFDPAGPQGCSGRPVRPGVMRLLGSGILDVDSGSDAYGVNLFDEYHLQAYGRIRLVGSGGYVAADHGTRLTLFAASGSLPAGRLELRNNGGWLEGRDPFGLPLSQIDNRGRVSKSVSTGSTVIDARFPSNLQGPTSVSAGTLAYPGIARGPVRVGSGRVYASGRCAVAASAQAYGCGAVPTATDPQTTRVLVPSSDRDGANIAMVERTRTIAGLGHEVRVDVTGLAVSRALPAVLSLRYDRAIRGSKTPATTRVLRQHGTSSWVTVPSCTSTGRLPSTATSCVDRRRTASRILSDGDLYLVVRTLGFSRWVGR